jgi:hypothetical protein
MYDVDAAVGPGASNRRDDVLLVQFFLFELYSEVAELKKRDPFGDAVRKKKREALVDGIFGPFTAAWILDVQRFIKSKGRTVHVDGRVDPSRSSYDKKSTITRTTYTIVHLNSAFRRRHMLQHDHLDRHPRIPAELKVKLRDFANQGV